MDSEYQHETFRLETEHWWYRARRKIILSQVRHHFRTRIPQPSEGRLRILDIGCGAGTILSGLRKFGEAIGLDASAAAAKAAALESSCIVRKGAIPDAIPADLGSFDAVCLFDVIEHLADEGKALRCARDLLNEDGTLFVTVPALPRLWGIHDEINGHRRRYTRASLTAALADAGFTSVRVSYFSSLLSPIMIPAICWRNIRRSGHHFQVRTRLAPIFELVFGLERHLLQCVRLPFGLSLIASATKSRSLTPVGKPTSRRSRSVSTEVFPASTCHQRAARSVSAARAR